MSAVDICHLSNRVSQYPCISQGKTRIPGVNDSADAEATDVRIGRIPCLTGSVRLVVAI